MQLNRFAEVAAFAGRAAPFLMQHEAEHNLMLGLLGELERDPLTFGLPPYLALVEQASTVAAVALMTPPHHLLLSQTEAPDALALIAQDVALFRPDLPSLQAPVEIASAFVQLWEERSGSVATRVFAERIYQLTAVRPPAVVPGRLRLAAASDRALVHAWVDAFLREGLGEIDPERAARTAERWLAGGTRALYLWEDQDGVPATMTGVAGSTPSGIRISAVYSPPEQRRRGYASACVAAVSQLQLDQGRRFCFLFTDLANPTSNHIYQQIGYEPVCDVDVWGFAYP
ncbi:MAG: GNAT family N-acetyltransferase [Roseiflexaceae bacterium]